MKFKKVLVSIFLIVTVNSFAQTPVLSTQKLQPLDELSIIPEIFSLIKSHRINDEPIFSNLKNYIPTPGDTYALTMLDSNNSAKSINLILPETYKLDLPGIGKYNVKNKNLFELQEDIVKKISYALPLNYTTFNLVKPANFNIVVYGAVFLPGEKAVNSLVTVLDAIYLAGGLKPGASYRKIKLTRETGEEIFIDFKKYYADGDVTVNQKLKMGDKIFIPKADITTIVSGAVFYPGTFEILEEEFLSDAILMAGNIRPTAVQDKYEIYRLDNDGSKEILSVSATDAGNFKLKNIDVINIRLASENLNMITIDGAIFGKNTPKDSAMISPTVPLRIDIPYHKGITLLNVLDIAGGPTPYAILEDSFILKKNSFEKTATNIKDLWEKRDLNLDIHLEPGDKVVIPIETLVVFIGGEVNRPNAITFNRGLSLTDYIMMAGGYTDKADRNKIFTIDEAGKLRAITKDFLPTPGCTIYVEKNFAQLSNEVFKDVMIYTSFISSIVATASSIVSLSLSVRDWFRNN